MVVQRKIFIPLVAVAVLGTSGAAWFFSNHRAASSDELTLYGNVDLQQAQLASQRQVVPRLEAGSRPEEISKAQADGVDRHSCVQYHRSAVPIPPPQPCKPKISIEIELQSNQNFLHWQNMDLAARLQAKYV